MRDGLSYNAEQGRGVSSQLDMIQRAIRRTIKSRRGTGVLALTAKDMMPNLKSAWREVQAIGNGTPTELGVHHIHVLMLTI